MLVMLDEQEVASEYTAPVSVLQKALGAECLSDIWSLLPM